MKNIFRRLPMLCAVAAILLADGGALVLRKQAGPLVISVFGSPQPLRVGPADLSVMVQQVSDQSTVLDADVNLHLVQTGVQVVEVFAPAKHENATNKLLYAARIHLPSAGSWRLIAMVHSPSKGDAEVTANVTVLGPRPPLLAYWPYFAVVPVLVILFAVNQILKNRRRARA